MNFSLWELGLIVLVALLVLGPEQLVCLSRFLGRFWRRAQRAFESAKDEFDGMVDLTNTDDKDTDDKDTTAKPKKKGKPDGGR